MEVTQQSSVLLIKGNQVQATRVKDAAKAIIPEEAITKDVVDDVDNSTSPHTHNQPGTSREKWTILVRS